MRATVWFLLSAAVVMLVVAIFAAGQVSAASPQDVPPSLPEVFYGNAYLNGSPAPVGTAVHVSAAGSVNFSSATMVVSNPGVYATGGNWAPILILQGNIAQGADVYFTVNGHPAFVRVGNNWYQHIHYAPGDAVNADVYAWG